MAPIWLTLLLLKRIFRTILYFLTIKEASDLLSLYWHRAFLLDYMCKEGYLRDEETAVIAAEALRDILDRITTSPLNQLARQVLALPSHVLCSLRRVRQGKKKTRIWKERAPSWPKPGIISMIILWIWPLNTIRPLIRLNECRRCRKACT
ncbi:MAG: hypothetical protein M5U14_19695 [Acidimicrobiia bacterium]|nr:hypothetical protein [Acidimicrobiia bacterium]